MKRVTKVTGIVIAVVFLLAGSVGSSAHDPKTRTYIEAVAEGTSTQMGRIISVIIIINEYSPPEDHQVLLEAFEKGGQNGLVNALSKMKSKGRLAVTGTLGYDINYIRQFKTPNGQKIRFVTDRPIRFGEAWAASRSSDYDLSGGEIDLSDEKGKSAGTLAPLCRFTVDKNKELQLKLFQNPWRLVNIRLSK